MNQAVEWISFKALEAWQYPQLQEHQYCWVTDHVINDLLASGELSQFQLVPSWDALSSSTSTRSDNPIHAKIISKMVQLFRDGESVCPIAIEASDDIRITCSFCVKDGHHRLRALQYLEEKNFPAILEGQNGDALRALRNLNQTRDECF